MRLKRLLPLLALLAICAVPAFAALQTSSVYSTLNVSRCVEHSQQLTLHGRWDQAASELLKSISIAEKAHNRPAESRLRTEYARVVTDRNFFHHRDREAAEHALENAQRLAASLRNQQSLSDLAQIRGQLLYSDAFLNGDYESPRKYFSQALTLRKALADARGLSETHFYLGLTYEQQSRQAEALPHYKEALALAEKSGDKVLQSYPHRHIGGLDEEAGRLDAAYRHIRQSLALRQQGGFTVGVPYAMLQLADFVAKHRGERERAIDLTERAIDLAESANSPRARFAAQLSLAQLELERKQSRAALSYAQCALDGAREFGEPDDVTNAEKQLAEIRKKM